MTELMTKIGPYINFQKGKAPSLTYEQFEEGLKPYLSPEYLRGSDNHLYVQQNGKLVEIEDGEIIVLWDGSNAGEIFISKKGILASTMTKLIVNEDEFDRRYFNYSMKYLEYILKAKTVGSGIPHVDKGIIKNLEILKPSKPEQQKIAAILTKVDDAIQAVKSTIEKAERLKKALMQNLLTGKLKPDGTWRRGDEFYEDEKFGKYPKDWSFGRFKEFSVLQRGKDLTYNEVILGKYPVVKSNGIQIYHNDYFVEPPGVVTGRSGTIGKVFYIEDKFWAHNTSLYIKDFKGNNEKYIYYLILRMKFNHYYAGTTVPTLNRNDIHKIKVAIPQSYDEQIEIVNKIDVVQKILINKSTKIQKLERLKKALMQNLLTGKVRMKV